MIDQKYRGLIIIGYQGIGKSTYACQETRCIDLESSNFKINGNRQPDWYIIYCKIAISLAKQGYVVFTSSHKQVINEFASQPKDNGYDIIIVAPSKAIGDSWIDRLRMRYEMNPTIKNKIAWKDAENNFYEEIDYLMHDAPFPIILINDIKNHYMARVIKGCCEIYHTHTRCTSGLARE